MKISDTFLALYLSYTTIEAIRKPKNDTLKHCCIIWLVWYSLVITSQIIDVFFWWVPFISLFDTFKLLTMISIFREQVADNVRSLVIQPIYQKSKRKFPIYFNFILNKLERIPYFITYEEKFKNLWITITNLFQSTPIDIKITKPKTSPILNDPNTDSNL